MAVKVHDRDEYLKAARKRRQEESQARSRMVDRTMRGYGPFDFLKDLWASIWRMGMYSSDPTTARQAIVYNTQKAYQQQQLQHAAEREQDRQQRLQEMQVLGRAMAQEMLAEAERRRPTR